MKENRQKTQSGRSEQTGKTGRAVRITRTERIMREAGQGRPASLGEPRIPDFGVKPVPLTRAGAGSGEVSGTGSGTKSGNTGAGETGKGRLERVRNTLGRATGLNVGRDFAREVHPRVFADTWHSLERRLALNLLAEDRARSGDFGDLARMWGLTEERVEEYVRAKTRESLICLGLCLAALLAVACNLLWPPALSALRLLSLFAATSFLAAALLALLAAVWRVRVCRTRTFVPFTTWLAAPFRFFARSFTGAKGTAETGEARARRGTGGVPASDGTGAATGATGAKDASGPTEPARDASEQTGEDQEAPVPDAAELTKSAPEAPDPMESAPARPDPRRAVPEGSGPKGAGTKAPDRRTPNPYAPH